jgi:hypothetical protein
MARYRKIDTRMWGDSRFRKLSSPGPSGKYLWMFLLTGPQTSNIPGLFRTGEMALAEELEWSLEEFQKAFEEAFSKGLVKADWKARVVWIPNAIKYNQPESPNVVKSWRTTWDEIPECPLKVEAHAKLRDYTEALGIGFAKAFIEACAKPLPNQEQEQEQEQNIMKTLPQTAFADAPARSSEGNFSKPTEAQLEQLYRLYPRKRDKLAAKKAIRKALGVVMAGDPDHPAMALDEALDYLAQRVTLYARCVQGCDREFVPYPASWFNAGSFWDDERDWSRRQADEANGSSGHITGSTVEKKPIDFTLTPDELVMREGLRSRTSGARS